MLRKTLFWIHCSTAVVVAVVILTMAATGVLLTYQKQLQSWADLRGLHTRPPDPNASTLPVSELVQSAQRVMKGKPSVVRWRAEEVPVEVSYGAAGSVYVNPYTGEVLGTGAERLRDFFRKVGGLHGHLALPGRATKVGTWITRTANLAFLCIILTGFILWWPRNWNVNAFRNALIFRRGLKRKARLFNWHNVIGFWCLVPLAIVIASAVVISYPWAGDLVYRLVGEEAPRAAPRRSGSVALPNQSDTQIVDVLVARAKIHDPHWRTLTMQLRPSVDSEFTFIIDRGTGGEPQKQAQLVLSATSGDVVKWEPFSKLSRGRQLRSVIRFAHTGEVAGLVGQTIAGLVSAAALFLVYTGISLALQRFVNWRRRRSELTPGRQVPPSRRRPHGKVPFET